MTGTVVKEAYGDVAEWRYVRGWVGDSAGFSSREELELWLVARKGGEWRSVCAGGDSCRECPAGGRCRDFQFASLEEAEFRLAAEGQAAWSVGGWRVNAGGEMVVEGDMRRLA